MAWLAYPTVKNFEDMFIRFDINSDERDTHTHTHTNTAWQHRPSSANLHSIARQKLGLMTFMRFSPSRSPGTRSLIPTFITKVPQEPPCKGFKFKREWSGQKWRKNADFRTINHSFSYTIEDGHIITIEVIGNRTWLSIGRPTNFDDLTIFQGVAV